MFYGAKIRKVLEYCSLSPLNIRKAVSIYPKSVQNIPDVWSIPQYAVPLQHETISQ